MAIARDNHAFLTATTAASATVAYTCTGSNQILFVGVVGELASDNITGVTYNGVSMTLIDKNSNGVSRWTYIFYLLNPASGSNNIVISAGSSSFIEGMAASYTGVLQSGQPDAHGFTIQGSASSSITKSLTTVADNCWIFGFSHTNTVQTYTATGRAVRLDGDNNNDTMVTYDTNGAVTPAGATSVGFSYSGTPGFSEIYAVSFSPAPSSIPNKIYSINQAVNRSNTY